MNDWGAKVFDASSGFYDNIRFVLEPAKRLVANAKIAEGQHVLDVACDTCWATMETAEVIGESGKVIGIDFSNKLLELAKNEATIAGLSNIEYYWGDAEALDFKDAKFDTVICASSIFFFQDISRALQEWYRVLNPGGTVAFSSFGLRFLQPGIRPLGELLSRFDGQPPATPLFLERTNTPEKCNEVLKHAGFGEIDIITEQLDYHFSDPEDYWKEINLTFVGRRLNQLTSSDLRRFKVEHLSEIESIMTNQDIFIELPTIFNIAKKGP